MKPPPDTKEQKLLSRIFDDASSAEESWKAIKLLKEETGLNRAGLVDRYTKPPTNGASDSFDLVFKLSRAQADLDRVRGELHQAKIEWRETQLLIRRMAVMTSDTDRVPEYANANDAILALHGMVNGPISAAFVRFPDGTEVVVAELGKLLADGGKTAGEILVAIAKRQKLREALTKALRFRGEVNAIRLGLYLKDIEGRVFDGVRLVGRRDEHRKQIVWFAEVAAGSRG